MQDFNDDHSKPRKRNIKKSRFYDCRQTSADILVKYHSPDSSGCQIAHSAAFNVVLKFTSCDTHWILNQLENHFLLIVRIKHLKQLSQLSPKHIYQPIPPPSSLIFSVNSIPSSPTRLIGFHPQFMIFDSDLTLKIQVLCTYNSDAFKIRRVTPEIKWKCVTCLRRTNNVRVYYSLAASHRRNIGATCQTVARRPATGPAPKTVPQDILLHA